MLFLYIILFIIIILTRSESLDYVFESAFELSKDKFIYSSTKLQDNFISKVPEVQQSSCKLQIKLLEKKFQNKLNYYKRKNAKYMKFLQKMYNDHQAYITSIYAHELGPSSPQGGIKENKDKLIQCEKNGYDVSVAYHGFCGKIPIPHGDLSNVPRYKSIGNYVWKNGIKRRNEIIESLK